jgi:hypothetical protein
METDNRCDIVFRKYFSDQRDVHATVCEKGAGGMSQIMEAECAGDQPRYELRQNNFFTLSTTPKTKVLSAVSPFLSFLNAAMAQ